MKTFVRRALLAVVVLAALVLVAGAALYHWIGQSDFRERVQRQGGAALGVPLRLGAIDVDWFPVPAIGLRDVQLQTQPPISAHDIEARPVWSALLRGEPRISTLVVRGAVVPQKGLDALTVAMQRGGSASSAPAPDGAPKSAPGSTPDSAPDSAPGAQAAAALLWLPERTRLDGLTYVDARGQSLTLDAQADLGADGLPENARVQLLKGRFEGAKAAIVREADRWRLDAALGGGTVKGWVSLRPPAAPGREMVLMGELQTRDVQVTALTAPSRPLSGRIDADTSLTARATGLGALADALRTQTRFAVREPVVNGLDLLKAVSTVGLSRGGETRLTELSGQVATQGRAARVTDIVARSGVLAARGDVAISPAKALSGRVLVDVTAGTAGKLTGVPLEVGGTLDAPAVSLSRGALVGAALGTAVAPGVGTGAGAKLGDSISRGLSGLFGGGKK